MSSRAGGAGPHGLLTSLWSADEHDQQLVVSGEPTRVSSTLTTLSGLDEDKRDASLTRGTWRQLHVSCVASQSSIVPSVGRLQVPVELSLSVQLLTLLLVAIGRKR